MMKKIIPVLFGALFLLSACGGTSSSTSSSTRPSIVLQKYCVEFYDGEDLIKRFELPRGSYLTEEEVGKPKKEGYYFLGWFVGDTQHDFNQPVKADQIIYAKWGSIDLVSKGYAEEFSSETSLSAIQGGLNPSIVQKDKAEDKSGLQVDLSANSAFSYALLETFPVAALTQLSVRYQIVEGTADGAWKFLVNGEEVALKKDVTLMGVNTQTTEPSARVGHIVLTGDELSEVLGNSATLSSVGFSTSSATTVFVDSVRVGVYDDNFKTPIPGTDGGFLLVDYSDKNAAANTSIWCVRWWQEAYVNLSYGWNGKECFFYGSNWANAYMIYNFPELLSGSEIADRTVLISFRALGGEQNHLYAYLIAEDGSAYYTSNRVLSGETLDDMTFTGTFLGTSEKDGKLLKDVKFKGIALTSRAAPNEYAIKKIEIL